MTLLLELTILSLPLSLSLKKTKSIEGVHAFVPICGFCIRGYPYEYFDAANTPFLRCNVMMCDFSFLSLGMDPTMIGRLFGHKLSGDCITINLIVSSNTL